MIESKAKPSRPWGETNQTAFGTQPLPADLGVTNRAILALGHQDIDPVGLEPPDVPLRPLVGQEALHS